MLLVLFGLDFNLSDKKKCMNLYICTKNTKYSGREEVTKFLQLELLQCTLDMFFFGSYFVKFKNVNFVFGSRNKLLSVVFFFLFVIFILFKTKVIKNVNYNAGML